MPQQNKGTLNITSPGTYTLEAGAIYDNIDINTTGDVVLQMNGNTIDASDVNEYGILVHNGNLKIELMNGSINTIKTGNNNGCSGIFSFSSLEIGGSGELNVSGGTLVTPDFIGATYAIFSDGGTNITSKDVVLKLFPNDFAAMYTFYANTIFGNVTVADGMRIQVSDNGWYDLETVNKNYDYYGYIKISAVPTKEVDLSKGNITVSNGTNAGTLKLDYTDNLGAMQSEDNMDADTQFIVNQTNPTTATANNITVNSTTQANIKLNGVNIATTVDKTSAILIGTGAKLNLNLADGTENTLCGKGADTITVGDTAQLTIGGTGKLTVNIDWWRYMGISSTSGDFIINGGNVTVNGSVNSSSGAIKLSDCTVTGGSLNTSTGTITVDNSTVGSAMNGGTGTVTINSGAITANGGIHGKNINLLGGTIHAYSTSGTVWDSSDSAIGRLNGEADNSECNINIAKEAKITAVNKYIQSGDTYFDGRGTVKKAIDGTVTGTATVFQGTYAAAVTAKKTTELRDSSGNALSSPLSITPDFDYRSLAFTAPENGDYTLYTDGIRQQGKKNGTYFKTFTLNTGLNNYTDVCFAGTPDIANGDILIENDGNNVKATYTDASGNIKTATGIPSANPIEISGTTSANTITVNVPGKTITLLLNGVQLTAPEGKSALTITDGGVILSGADKTVNTLTGGNGVAGVNGSVTLSGSGTININGGTGAAGISGNLVSNNSFSGNATVNGFGTGNGVVNNVTLDGSGTVNINGGNSAAGIAGAVNTNNSFTGDFSVTGGSGQPAVAGIINAPIERLLIMGGEDSANVSELTSGIAHTVHYIELAKAKIRTFDIAKGNITISDDTDSTIKVSYTDSFGQITMFGIDPSEMLTITQSNNTTSAEKYVSIDTVASKKVNLTIDGVNIFRQDGVIFVSNQSQVCLIVKSINSIWAAYSSSININTDAKLTIGGDGSLTVTQGYFQFSPISANELLAFTDSVQVTLNGGNSYNEYAAAPALAGTVTIEKNAKVTAVGGAKTGAHGGSAFSGSLTITGGTFEAKVQDDSLPTFASGSTLNLSNYSSPAITASNSIDGSNPVEYNADNLSSYRYLKIEPAVYSVDITWSAMEFTYVQSGWNTQTLSYDTDEWQCNTDSNKISVANNSNAFVHVSLTYANGETRTDTVAGEFYTDSAFTAGKKVTTAQPIAKEGTADY